MAQAKAFFSLDDSDPHKQRVRRGNADFGWMPTYSEPAYQPGTVSRLESFDCGVDNVRRDTVGDPWPDLPGFREGICDSWEHVSALGNSALSALSAAAGLGHEFLPLACNTQELNSFRLLRYPQIAADLKAREVGISAHTDFECITLIYQSAPGLEVYGADDRWYDLPASDGSFVVLLGDMLERWTNGTFRATGHRVRNTAHERFSIVMFFAVNAEIVIEPLPQFRSSNDTALYSPVTQESHIDFEVEKARQNANALEQPTST